jgi:hypothetical protein
MGVGRQAVAMVVHPDRIDAEALRHLDFPFQIIADQVSGAVKPSACMACREARSSGLSKPCSPSIWM